MMKFGGLLCDSCGGRTFYDICIGMRNGEGRDGEMQVWGICRYCDIRHTYTVSFNTWELRELERQRLINEELLLVMGENPKNI